MRSFKSRLSRFPAALGAGIILASSAVLAIPRAAPAWAFPSQLTIVGHGMGHGRGMGQYGALGYALAGDTYRQILGVYYGGTTLATTPVATITVRLSELDGATSVVVQAPSGSTLVVDGKAAGTSATLTPGHTVSSTNGGDVIVAGNWSNGSSREFAGQIAFNAATSSTPTQVDNVVDLDRYVEGVVPRESPASWPLATLEAQAVAARSYAIAYTGGGAVPICDSTYCQVYGGDPVQYDPTYSVDSNTAVTDTTGQVLECGTDSACGAPTHVALAEYSASTGGYTAGGAFPAVPDAGDATPTNPYHDWTVTVPSSAVEAAFPSVGALSSLTVTARNGFGDLGGRVQQVLLTGSGGNLTVTGSQFAGAMGLDSDWFALSGTTAAVSPPANTSTTPPAPTGTDTGYWVVASNGSVYPFGSAPSYGSMAGKTLNAPVVGMAPTGDGAGYWLVASDGGIFSYGDAAFHGSTGGYRLNRPVIGMASTPDSGGYWLVASDGGIFTFGDARFFGSTGALPLVKPVVAMARTADGGGYWLVASDGGVFSFGDAKFHGSAASLPLVAPIVGMVPTADGGGYWLVASDGGVFAYGDAGFVGSLGGKGVTDVASVSPTPDGGGYLLVTRSGHVYSFGDATSFGDPATSVSGWSGSALGVFARG